jgi:hypothetical protein
MTPATTPAPPSVSAHQTRAANGHGVGTERESFSHVHAAAYAAVDDERRIAAAADAMRAEKLHEVSA